MLKLFYEKKLLTFLCIITIQHTLLAMQKKKIDQHGYKMKPLLQGSCSEKKLAPTWVSTIQLACAYVACCKWCGNDAGYTNYFE